MIYIQYIIIYNVTESIFDWSDLIEKMGLRKFAKIFKIFEKKDDKQIEGSFAKISQLELVLRFS